jgi:hypothetical protein
LTVARELARYKSDVVAVQEFRGDTGGISGAGEYIFFLWKRKQKHQLGTGILHTIE